MTNPSKEEAIIETHMEHLNKRLDRFDNLFEKIFDRQDEFSKVLERNTITVEEHHKRSTMLETIIGSIKRAFESLEKRISALEQKVDEVEDDITPIKKHVGEVNALFHLFSWMPKIVQGLILVLTFVTAVYGLVSIVKDLYEPEITQVHKVK